MIWGDTTNLEIFQKPLCTRSCTNFNPGSGYRGGVKGGTGGFGRTPFDSKCHFYGHFRIGLINSEYRIYPEYSPPCFLPHTSITKTYLYNFDPFKPHFYIVKLGFTGVYIIFLISAQNIDCERGGSNEYLQSIFWAEIWKISEFFSWKFPLFGSKIWIGVFL